MDDNSDPVALINLFEVPAAAEEGLIQAAAGQAGFRQAAAAIQHRAHPSPYRVVRR
jgi:hypothetical protein